MADMAKARCIETTGYKIPYTRHFIYIGVYICTYTHLCVYMQTDRERKKE